MACQREIAHRIVHHHELLKTVTMEQPPSFSSLFEEGVEGPRQKSQLAPFDDAPSAVGSQRRCCAGYSSYAVIGKVTRTVYRRRGLSLRAY